MNREEQLKFISDNYPATIHHISKRAIRHGFFKNIQTEIQAYLLGFYAADGSVDKKRKTFRVTVLDRDEEIINLLQTFISKDARIFKNNPNKSIKGRHGEIYYHQSCTGIDITSAELTDSLVQLGFGYRKTWTDLHLPNINKKLLPHFIRGYFDGDGSITIWYVAPWQNRNERIRAKMDIVSKTSSLLTEILKYLSENDIDSLIHYLKRDNMYRLSIGSKAEIKKFGNLLYNNANFFLSRKKEKFDHYVNTEVTQLITEYRNALLVSASNSNNPTKSVEHPTNEDENVR